MKKKKGYVLAVVMIFSLLLATVLVTTFAICHRYHRSAQRNMQELRQEVYHPMPVSGNEGSGDGAGGSENGKEENPSGPSANASNTAPTTFILLPQDCGERQA